MNILEMDLGPLVPHHSIEIIVGIILLLLLTWLIAKAVVPRFEKRGRQEPRRTDR